MAVDEAALISAPNAVQRGWFREDDEALASPPPSSPLQHPEWWHFLDCRHATGYTEHYSTADGRISTLEPGHHYSAGAGSHSAAGWTLLTDLDATLPEQWTTWRRRTIRGFLPPA